MARIFLTGSKGRIGSYFMERLRECGAEAVGYDRKDGNDLLDPGCLDSNIAGCDSVLHLAVSSDSDDDGRGSLGDNLQSLWNLLESSAKAGIRKVLYMSSVDALGIFKGEAEPSYFPIDDDHPCKPRTPYGIAKKLSEEMCRLWSAGCGIPSICLRPPGVWFDNTYQEIAYGRRADPEFEWKPYWEYGAFIDVRDLFDACMEILDGPTHGAWQCYLIAADDMTSSGMDNRGLTAKIHPKVEWKRTGEYDGCPFKSLLDCSRLEKTYGWRPRYSWENFVRNGQMRL